MKYDIQWKRKTNREMRQKNCLRFVFKCRFFFHRTHIQYTNNNNNNNKNDNDNDNECFSFSHSQLTLNQNRTEIHNKNISITNLQNQFIFVFNFMCFCLISISFVRYGFDCVRWNVCMRFAYAVMYTLYTVSQIMHSTLYKNKMNALLSTYYMAW